MTLKRLLLFLLFIFYLFYPATEKLFALNRDDNDVIPLSAIIRDPEQYDGKEVTVVGRYEIGIFGYRFNPGQGKQVVGFPNMAR